MEQQIYLALGAILIGLGIASMLSRKNIFSILLAFINAMLGVLVVFGVLIKKDSLDGMLFLLALCAVLFLLIIIGCVVAYRRHMSMGSIDITEASSLKN